MHQQQQPVYNDLNASFTSEGTDVSYDSDSTFQIFNELQYTLQKQQQQQQQQSSNSAAINIQNPTTNGYNTGIIYGFRTRHLSCIEENDSDSLHSSSIPKQAFEMIQDVDEKFKKLVSEEVNTTSTTSWLDTGEDEVDHIIMIDESRLYDTDYFEELSASQFASKIMETDEQFGINGSEELWQSTVSEPVYRTRFNGGRPNIPDIMTTSCYGALNSSFGSEMSGPTGYSEQSTPTKSQSQCNKPEPIYATPEKRRDCNRSFDSSCPSQSSSLYGGSMTSSLDLKCMSPSGYMAQTLSLAPNSTNNPLEVSNISMDNSKSEWNSTGDSSTAIGIISSAEDMTDEMAVKCITAAENDLQSIRRLLEHDTSGSVCPSCRISFDKGKRRKLIDTCGHERCYSCMFRNDQCPMCMNSSLKDVDCSNTQGYDTGIGGSTSTIVSPLGSPQPQLRSQVQRANELALDRYMQHNRQESISPEYHRYASIGKLPKASSSSLAANANNNKYNQTGNSPALGTTASALAPGKAGLKQHTVTADIHNNNGISHGHNNGTSSSSSITSSKIGHSNVAHLNTASTNNNGHQYNVANVAATSTYNYSEIHASAFATPPTRRRFFNHKNLRNALTGVSGVVASHRRTASNGGGCPIDSASILSEVIV